MRKLRDQIIMLTVAAAALLAYTVVRFVWLVSTGIGGPLTFSDFLFLLGILAAVGGCVWGIVRNARRMLRGTRTSRAIIWMFREIHTTDSDGDPTTHDKYTIRLEHGGELEFDKLPAYGRNARLMETPGTHIILRWIEGTDVIDLIEPDPAFRPPMPYDVVEEREDKSKTDYTITRRMATLEEHNRRLAHLPRTPYGAPVMPVAAWGAPNAAGAVMGEAPNAAATNAETAAGKEHKDALDDAKTRYAVLFNPPTLTFLCGLFILIPYQLWTMSPYGAERVLQNAVVFVAALVFAVWMLIHMAVQGAGLAADDLYRHEPKAVRATMLRRNIVRHCIGVAVFLVIGLVGLSGVSGTLHRGPVTEPVTFSSLAYHTETDSDGDDTDYTDFTFTDASGKDIGISVESADDAYVLHQIGNRTGRGLILTYWDLGGGTYVYDHASPDASTE